MRTEQAAPDAAGSAPGSSAIDRATGGSAHGGAAGPGAGGALGGDGGGAGSGRVDRPEVLDPADMWRLGMARPADGGSAAGSAAGQSDGFSEDDDEAQPLPGGGAAEAVSRVRPAGGQSARGQSAQGHAARHRREQLADEGRPRSGTEQGGCQPSIPKAWLAPLV